MVASCFPHTELVHSQWDNSFPRRSCNHSAPQPLPLISTFPLYWPTLFISISELFSAQLPPSEGFLIGSSISTFQSLLPRPPHGAALTRTFFSILSLAFLVLVEMGAMISKLFLSGTETRSSVGISLCTDVS